MRATRSSWRAPRASARPHSVAAARAQAAEAGLLPLSARGAELERAFGFGVVRQLLEPAVHDRERAVDFDGAAQYAAALFDITPAKPVALPFGPEGSFAVLRGLHRLTANLARAGPVALFVRRRALGGRGLAALPGVPRRTDRA